MQFYNRSVEDVVTYFGSDAINGISGLDIKDRVKQYGYNKLEKRKKKGVIRKFISQFDNAMIMILIISAVISFFLALDSGDKKEFLEPVVILFIVFLNATLGVLQESRAEKTLEELNKLASSTCKVIRDGKCIDIDTLFLVPGDIVLLEGGNIVPADCRVIEEIGLKVDESFLTGESESVCKHCDVMEGDVNSVGDISNMLFSGSSVMMGKCRCIVCDIGMNTQIGKIASSLGEDVKSPIENKLEILSKYIGFGALILCLIIFVLGLFSGIPLIDMFMISISLAVAAIPEGLPALVTIVFALGVQKMSKRNAVIRKLPSVETLGSASVICSDKTGTLTENKLTLVKVGVLDSVDVNLATNKEKEILRYALMCTSDNGDPIDISIYETCKKYNIDMSYEMIYEMPFDSVRKCMSVVVENNGVTYLVMKGAYEVVSKKCKVIDGNVKSLVDSMSSDGLRVICVAIKRLDNKYIKSGEYLERDMNYLGILGFKDLPRKGIEDAVRVCNEAGIKPVMITGDYVLTAKSIAKSIGIYKDSDIALTGEQLHKMSDDELHTCIDKVSVYARVNPEDKIRIVKMWQRKGKVVAMTGDGVNDAPALKAADIGCAMGKNGTEVAKNAADLVLLDDNFSTIVESVKEGRRIYDNVKKSILFLLGTNMGEIFTMLFAMLFWQISPLLSMQLLWVNLVTDITPALALGLEKADDDIMKKAPKDKNEKLLSLETFVYLLFQGMFFSLLVLIGFVIGKRNGIEYARTMSFIIISLSQMFHAYNVRSDKSLFKIGFFSNKYLVYSTLITVSLISFVCFVPALATLFSLTLLRFKDYFICLLLSFMPIVLSEIKKN